MNNLLEATLVAERSIGHNPLVKRIVVAIDLSEHSRKTTEYAVALARRFGASLTLVYVFEQEQITFTTPQVGEAYENTRHHAELTLLGVFEEVRQNHPDCEMEFRVGEPAEQIKTTALLLNADLVVIASHHPASPLPFFAADQAQEISRDLSCPVLVYNGTGTAGDAARKPQLMDGSVQSPVS
jgi:nucleotide-binding universal stress UspA family protein